MPLFAWRDSEKKFVDSIDRLVDILVRLGEVFLKKIEDEEK